MEPPLPAAAASAPSSSNGGMATPSWSSSTNWTVGRGSLHDTICFESSASILEGGGVDDDDDDGAVSVSGGLLLTRPVGCQSDPPCEINICFRERHEIHRIYVRSTARVYEIYYASEQEDDSNEYLCTVRCGATGKEVFLPRCNIGEVVLNPLKDRNASLDVPAKMAKNGSSTSSEEDGWVEVKVPDSPLLADGSNTISKKKDGATGANGQICYEATAEISEANPCISLKLRLLSLQAKECLHIEEVYIYADPVESMDSGSPVSMGGNMTGNSLLAMLVPSMLQLSKAGSDKIQNGTVFCDPAVQKHGVDASITNEEINPELARVPMQKTCSSVVEKEEQFSAPTVLNEKITPFASDNEVPGLPDVPKFVPEKVNTTHDHLGKILDELVLRVGKIEASLSRFEENMLKPLCCIDTRLQRVEQQLDALSLRTSPKPFQCSRISAPEFQFDDCDSDGAFDISDAAKEDATVNSPDVVKEETTVSSNNMVKEDVTVDSQNAVRGMLAGSSLLLVADGVTSALSSDICAGLFIKAPEFLNEEDEHISSNDMSESAAIPCSKGKASLSIDDALTSALKAFMLSASTNSPKHDSTSVSEAQSSNEAVNHPKLDENVGRYEAAETSGVIFNETNRVCHVNLDSSPDIISPKDGEGQGMCHPKWPHGSSGGLAIDEVSSNNQDYAGRDDASEIDEQENESRKMWTDVDSDSEVAPNVPNLITVRKNWNEESSSDSNIDESIIESHHNMDWWDENSSDSENEFSTLRNWLYGRQDDHRFKQARFMAAMNGHSPTTEVGDASMRYTQDKSMAEIQKALNSSENGESKRGIQQVLDTPLNDESSLLDVQFVRHEKSNVDLPFGVLMMGEVDSQIEAYGSDWFNDGRTTQQHNSCLMDIPQVGAPVAIDNLLIDLDDVMVKRNEFNTDGNDSQLVFSSLI